MKPISSYGLPLGISFMFWAIIGGVRLIASRFSKSKPRTYNIRMKSIAAVIPAHNEELVIRRCISALKEVLPKKNIYVISDGSRDKTTVRARMEGVHVSFLKKGRGKARGLMYLFNRYKLFDRYKFIFIVDADTYMDPTCLKNALYIFNDKKVGVVFASSQIRWPQHYIPKLSCYFIAYRDRLNRMLQYFFVYGQTWKYTNVNYVIPGFATLYRSDILRKLDIDTPGLLIEDFNLAFQFHKRKLGKIGYSPTMIGWDQYPTNLTDYWKQVRRWNIGFFQTVRKNGFWISFFWLALGIFSLEVLLNSLFIVILPFFLILLLGSTLHLQPSELLLDFFQGTVILNKTFLMDIIISFFLIDYLFTAIIGIINKKPQFLFYGLFFIFMHYVTSLILISSLGPGLFGKSSGRWVSPKRLKF